MTEGEKELIKAANLIKQYCDDGYACENCIFNNCMFDKKRPYEWEFEEEGD